MKQGLYRLLTIKVASPVIAKRSRTLHFTLYDLDCEVNDRYVRLI